MQYKNILKKLKNIPPVAWMILLLIVIYFIFCPGFFSFGNILNVSIQFAPLLIVSIGMTIVILTEGIDLSIGYVMSFVGVCSALLLQAGYSTAISILGGLAVGILFGFFNGILISKIEIPPFIATLGMGIIAYGLGLLMTGGLSIPARIDSFRFIFEGALLGVRLPIILALLIFTTFYILLYYSTFGRNVIALGGNKKALHSAGVNIIQAKIFVYIVMGMLAAVGGLIIAARTGTGYAAAAEGWEFDAIASTIIGGNSFKEGKGGIEKTVLGAILLSVLKNGLNIAGISTMYQFALIGIFVVSAIIVDTLVRRKRES